MTVPQTQDLEESPLTLKQLDTVFHNVLWARENIDLMLSAIADHRDDGHDCPPYCLPADLAEWLGELPRGGVLMLMTVMLKDAVVTEEVE